MFGESLSNNLDISAIDSDFELVCGIVIPNSLDYPSNI
jgi:hypothetical protein